MFNDIRSAIYGGTQMSMASAIDHYNKTSTFGQNFERTASDHIKNMSMQIHRNFLSHEAIVRSNLIAREAEMTLKDDQYISLVNGDSYMSLNNYTKEHVMAHPTIRKMWERDEIEGFAVSGFVPVFNPDREEILNEIFNPYYTNARNGMITPSDEHINYYHRVSLSSLNGFDKFNIHNSWRNVLSTYDDDLDLTDA